MYKLVSQHLQRQHLQVIFHLFRFPVHTIWLEEIFRLPLLSSPLYQTINYSTNWLCKASKTKNEIIEIIKENDWPAYAV